ncbi:MAG: HAMP domain-containing histidine kinase [Clostridia bacterium]|nr:HAMP domain-containing histidine kinase [Clostridia bacterium]
MEFIVFILIFAISVLSFYLFLLKKEIRRTTKKIQDIESEKSNILINKEFDDKDMNKLIMQINILLKSINNREIMICEKNNSLQKMITNIAHDLRTPLTSALGYIDILKNKQLSDEENEKYISIIEERLYNLSYLITNFFEFSKIISKDEEIELKKQNVIGILEKSISNFYDDFSKSNRIIELNTDFNKVEIMTNTQLISRVFDNLIINAYKHSNSNLIINLKKENNKVQIVFINKLEDEDIDIGKVFDEFYTADISRTKGNTGLGLAIAKEFVNLLNGEIYAKREDNYFKIVINL